jgi:hypothetical protein
MEMNEYALQVTATHRLAEARAAAARETLGRLAAGGRGDAWRTAGAAIARLYARVGRWSSAASTGSKPMTARAWSRSR